MYDYQAAALHGRHVDAYRAMKRVVDLVPGSQWVVQLGWAAIWAGRPREAIAILTNIEPRWIGDERSLLPTAGGPRYWNALTTARHLAGDFSGELSDVARMRRGNPDAGRVTELMALAALGRVEDVERRTLELLNTTPAGTEGNVRDVARELRAHGHEAAAQRLFERIIEWRQRAPVVKQTQGYRQDLASLMFDAGRWSETRALNEALLAEEPENWVAAGHLGILAAMSGDRPEAERKLTWLLEREREFDTGEPTVWAAAVASHLGELERAIAIYERGLEKGFYQYHRSIHVRRALAPLFAYPPFVEMMRPKG